MNERIRELMGKTLDSEFSHTWDTMTYEGLLQFSEKFAELIVKECIVVAADAERGGSNDIWDNAVKFIRRDLQEHFGVEE